MGKILIIKGANFADNALDLDIDKQFLGDYITMLPTGKCVRFNTSTRDIFVDDNPTRAGFFKIDIKALKENYGIKSITFRAKSGYGFGAICENDSRIFAVSQENGSFTTNVDAQWQFSQESIVINLESAYNWHYMYGNVKYLDGRNIGVSNILDVCDITFVVE